MSLVLPTASTQTQQAVRKMRRDLVTQHVPGTLRPYGLSLNPTVLAQPEGSVCVDQVTDGSRSAQAQGHELGGQPWPHLFFS